MDLVPIHLTWKCRSHFSQSICLQPNQPSTCKRWVTDTVQMLAAGFIGQNCWLSLIRYGMLFVPGTWRKVGLSRHFQVGLQQLVDVLDYVDNIKLSVDASRYCSCKLLNDKITLQSLHAYVFSFDETPKCWQESEWGKVVNLLTQTTTKKWKDKLTVVPSFGHKLSVNSQVQAAND